MIRNQVTKKLIKFNGTHFNVLLKRQLAGEAKYFLKQDIVKLQKLVKGGNTDPNECGLCLQEQGQPYEDTVTRYDKKGKPYQQNITGTTEVIQTKPCGHYSCILCIQKWNYVSKEQTSKNGKKTDIFCPWCRRKIDNDKNIGIFSPPGVIAAELKKKKANELQNTTITNEDSNKEIENIRASAVKNKSFIFYETIKLRVGVTLLNFLNELTDPDDIQQRNNASKVNNIAYNVLAKMFMLTDDMYHEKYKNNKNKYGTIWIDGCIIQQDTTKPIKHNDYTLDVQIVLASTSQSYKNNSRINLIRNGSEISSLVIDSLNMLSENISNTYRTQTITVKNGTTLHICVFSFNDVQNGPRWTSEQKLNMDEYKRIYMHDTVKKMQNVLLFFNNKITYKVGYWKKLLDEIDKPSDDNKTDEEIAAKAMLELNGILANTRLGHKASSSGYTTTQKSNEP